jgi:nicotinamide riboside transporter PnuC
MTKTLWQELFHNTLISLGIYAALFFILYIIEWFVPSLRGTLLQWHDLAFIIGIPASVAGTAYVLTIQNPKNYTGFVGAIIMAALLAWQFALWGNWDLVVLHIALFIPFQTTSLLRWRKQAIENQEKGAKNQDIFPSWLSAKGVVFNIVFTIVIVLLDELFVSWMAGDDFADNLLSKVMGGLMIAASILANFWMIHKKIDTWIWWIVYTLAGMVIYVLTNNIFTFVLFLITLVLNIKAAVEWIKLTRGNEMSN